MGLKLLLLQNTDFVNKYDLVFLKKIKHNMGQRKALEWGVVVFASDPSWSPRRMGSLKPTLTTQ